MEIPAEARALHRSFSPRAEELLDRVAADPARAAPHELPPEVVPRVGTVSFGQVYRLPVIVDGEQLAEMRRIATVVPRLLTTVPERVFGNQPSRVARFYDQKDVLFIAQALRQPTGAERMICRGDFVQTAAGLKCLEINATVRLGGWNFAAFVEPMFYRRPWLRELLEREPALRFTDPPRVLLEHLAEQAYAALSEAGAGGPGAEVNIAAAVGSEATAAANRPFEEILQAMYQEVLAAHDPPLSGTIFITTYPRLRERGGFLYEGERRVHALLENHGPQMDPTAFRLSKAGRLHLYNGPLWLMVGDKRTLAALSEHQESEAYSAEEREMIRKYVPWSRVAQEGTTQYEGERVSLLDLALGRRERFVFKNALEAAGQQVYVGRYTEPAAWREVIEKNFNSRQWVLQEWQESVPLWFWGGEGGEMVTHDGVWGFFAFGQRFGGGFLRLQRGTRTGVLNTRFGSFPALFLEGQEAAGS